jgi:hypothetical protein
MRELFGGCLLATGILIAGLTGLCTLMFIIGIDSWRDVVDIFGFAAIPLIIGVGFICAGRWVIQSARHDDWRNYS